MFDVVMLVFISGLTACRSIERIQGFMDYLRYVWKRIKRLLFPTWIFLTGYFIFAVVINPLIPNSEFERMTMVDSYTLYEGIGYVWIIRIYLWMALLAPVLFNLTKNINSSYLLAVVSVAAMLVNSLAIYVVQRMPDSLLKTDTIDVFLPILGYGIVYAIAMKYYGLSRTERRPVILAVLIMFICGCAANGGFNVRVQKYPPNIIYLSYGILVSMLLYELFGNLRVICAEHAESFALKILIWISQHSLDIYFAHILVKFFFKYLWEDAPFYIEYPILVVGGIVLTLVKNELKRVVSSKVLSTLRVRS